MTFNTGTWYNYQEFQENPDYTSDFVEWYSLNSTAYQSTELKVANQGSYPSHGGSKEKRTQENIFLFINEKKKEWKIRVNLDGTDVCK